jgi:hypothetical protein
MNKTKFFTLWVCAATTLSSLIGAPAAVSQDVMQPAHAALMERMVGEWLMTGTIAGDEVTHDVDAEWILQRRYVRLHEVSRERREDGELAYEAWIHIAWDAGNEQYVVMWLDNTETTNFASEGVGRGRLDGDRIPFVWRFADGSGIRNTFEYDRENDTWSWTIDNVDDSGGSAPFARLNLERK